MVFPLQEVSFNKANTKRPGGWWSNPCLTSPRNPSPSFLFRSNPSQVDYGGDLVLFRLVRLVRLLRLVKLLQVLRRFRRHGERGATTTAMAGGGRCHDRILEEEPPNGLDLQHHGLLMAGKFQF